MGRKHSKNEEGNTEKNKKEAFYKNNRKQTLKKLGRKH